jgi:type IV pilus assembly PilO-like protein
MTAIKSMPKHHLAIVGLVLLVLTGFVIDLGVISPKLSRVALLSDERVQLETRLSEVMNGRFREVDARRALGIEDLETYMKGPNEDQVTYVGRQIEDAGLMRLDLSTVDKSESQNVVITRFDVRVTGDYNEIVSFVKAMESNPRLTEFHNFVIETPLVGQDIEGRFNLSIYDPKTRR